MLINELMKPPELKQVATNAEEYVRPERFVDLMKKYNLEPFGEGGAFSLVYGNDTFPFIIKIFAKEDHAYMKYLRFVMKNPGNPHFPKVRGKAMAINEHLYAIRLEKLIDNEDAAAYDEYFIRRYLNNFDSKNNVPKRYKDEARNDILEEFGEDMIQALNYIIGIRGSDRYDIHPGNIMYRGDTSVIIDPFKMSKVEIDQYFDKLGLL